MAKKPTPAAAKPAASQAPPSADAAAAATNTQGAGAAPAAPGSAPGEGDPSPAGGGGASGDASSSNEVDARIDATIVELKAAGDRFHLALRDAVELALDGPPGTSRRVTDVMRELQGAALGNVLNLQALEIQAREDDGAGDLVEIQAKSRDGKPFRRAGHVFGSDFAAYLVTEDALARIRADRGIVLKALD